MSNIGNLVDRTFREYLEPMDDIVSYTTLTTGINDSVTSVVFNGDLLSVEEEDALDAGEELSRSGAEVAYSIASGLTAVVNVEDYDYKVGSDRDGTGTVSDNGTVTALTLKASF